MRDFGSKKMEKDSQRVKDLAREEALVWFTRLEGAPVNTVDRFDFLNWCEQNPENKLAYEQITELWASDIFAEALQLDEQRINHNSAIKPRRILPGLAMAASLLLSVWGVFQSNLLHRLIADQYTSVGQLQTVMLDDGSSIILDTDTAIKVSYSEQARSINLISGRAFFRVHPDVVRPFYVKTDDEIIRVVGTRFTVNTLGSTPLTVQQGVVSYKTHNNSKEVKVIAGEQLEQSVNQLDVITTDRQRAVFAWTDGRLKFTNQPFAEIMAEIDRYQPGLIIISNQKLSSLRVTGNYKLNNPSAIIASLAQATGAKVMKVSNYLTVVY